MHDKFGHPLTEGDEVLIHAKVTGLSGNAEYCNITVQAVEPMFPGDDHTAIVLNAKQVMKARKNKRGLPVPFGETIGPGSPEVEPDGDEDDLP